MAPMLIALLLATAHPHSALPDPAKDYAAYADFTGHQFECDDRPYTKGCGNDRPHRHHRLIVSQAKAELTRLDRAYARLRHPTARQTAAYLRRVIALSKIVCPNDMNDDDGRGNFGCD